MSHDIDRHAQALVHTSVDDALSGAHHASVAVIRRAIHLEDQKSAPRIALIRGLNRVLRKKEREQAAAPKDAA